MQKQYGFSADLNRDIKIDLISKTIKKEEFLTKLENYQFFRITKDKSEIKAFEMRQRPLLREQLDPFYI